MRRRLQLLTVVLIVAGAAGCQQGQPGPTDQRLAVIPGEDLISVYQLAEQLGLRVTETTSTHITLQNAANTVLIFTHTGGRAFVNGRAVGAVGWINKINGQIYLSRLLRTTLAGQMDTVETVEIPTRLSGRVVIDPGHGGKDPGAISYLGSYEKSINLDVSHKIAQLLGQRGLNVVLTRRDDTFLELEQRAELSNRYGAGLFASIHADSCSNRSVRGSTIYVARSASSRSYSAARTIANSLTASGFLFKGIRRADYRVLVHTKGPAVLIELGYLSNPSDASLLIRDSYQNRIAKAISQGICRFMTPR